MFYKNSICFYSENEDDFEDDEESFDDDEILCFQPQKDTTLPYVKEFNSQLVLICRYLQEKY